MPQFAANLNWLYTELPFTDRFEAAARDGLKAVELLSPYALPAAELKTLLNANGLQLVLFNAPPGGTDAASIEAAWASKSESPTTRAPPSTAAAVATPRTTARWARR